MSNPIFKKFEAKIDKKDRRLDISCEIDGAEFLRIHKEIANAYDSEISHFDWLKNSTKTRK